MTTTNRWWSWVRYGALHLLSHGAQPARYTTRAIYARLGV